MNKIYGRRISEAEYQAKINARLPADKLEEAELYDLMMHIEGQIVDAYRAPVYARKVERNIGAVSLSVCFVDRDLRQVGRGLPSIVQNNLWIPSIPMPIKQGFKLGESREGYFLPYDDQLVVELLAAREGFDRHAYPTPPAEQSTLQSLG